MLQTLHDGAKHGDLEAMREILEGPYIDVNIPEKTFGKTPIRWAVECGQLKVAELLLKHKARLDVADAIGRTPLLWAARHGHTRTVQFLLENGDSVKYRDNNGQTALSLAAREGYLEVVELLIKFGSEIEPKTVQDQTPLSFAAMNGHLRILLRLLEEGANPDSRESSQHLTPLLFATKNRHGDVVQLLVAHNCNIDSPDSCGRTSLSWAAGNGDEIIVRTLLEKRANINVRSKDGRTPLSYASEFGHTSITKLLLQYEDIEYDIPDTYYDQTPLSWAAEGGYDKIVSLLLDKEADADSRDRGGHTPLLWAIRNGRNAVVELLLKKEVDVIAKDEDKWTPLSWAANRGKELLTRRLLTKAVELDAKIGTAIAEAIEDALWRAMISLSEAKEQLERAERDPSLPQNTPIPSVPIFGLSQDRLKKAKKEQTEAEERAKLSLGNLDVKRAILLEYSAIVELISSEKYVHIRDYKKRTLLSWAAENGHDDVLRLLLDRQLSPNSVDQLRRAPISWAAIEGHRSTVHILLDYKVHPDWRDGAGRTPLSLAAEKGHEDVVRRLLDVDDDRIKQVPVLPLNAKKKPAVVQNDPHGSEYEYDMSSEAAGDFKPENGVDFDSRDDRGQTPLLFAAKAGHGKVAGLLLEKGANINIKVKDDKGEVKSLWKFLEDEINSPETDPLKTQNLLDVRTMLESSDKYGQLLITPVPDKASVDSEFMATIVQFLADDRGKGSGENLWRRCSVLELLNGKMTVEGEELQMSTCKWLHLPANNMRWIEMIIAKHYKDRKEHWKRNIVLKRELWTGLQHRAPEGIHHARFMRPTCQVLPAHTTDDVGEERGDLMRGLVLFMPYLHWETEDNLNEMKDIIRRHIIKGDKKSENGAEAGRRKSHDCRKYEDLVNAYLDDKHPLHIRRTLDQFYYHTLTNTDARDRDQAGCRYHEKFGLKSKKIITMVDQLWLWVLPGFGKSRATVITSFPQRSNRVDSNGKRNDAKFTSLVSKIIAQTENQPVDNGHDLAKIISSECSSIYFDTMTDRDRSLQFLEIYATSIGEITDRETECFQKFQDTLKLDKNDKVAEAALSITTEIKLLQEIKDIRDELNIMLSVFNAQRKALKDMARIMNAPGIAERRTPSGSSPALRRTASWGLESGSFLPLSTVDSNISEVEEMDKYAERAYMALNHLLDLKQKQANVSEAQATHKLIEATSSQGKMITFFTLITIVFMPLSFMAAFFAINIAEFPRDVDGLSLGYVSKYMFSISVAIIVPSILIAFNLQNMEDYIKRRQRAKHAGPAPGSAALSSAGPSSTGKVVAGASLQFLEAEGGRKQKVFDEELGRASNASSY